MRRAWPRISADEVTTASQSLEGNGRDFHMDIDPVTQRPADFIQVFADLSGRAAALARIAQKSALAGVDVTNLQRVKPGCRLMAGRCPGADNAVGTRGETEIGLMLWYLIFRLVPRGWTHSDELEGSALGPRSVVVHLIGDIMDDTARSDGNGVVLIELRPCADQESSGQDGDESLVGMRVRLAPIVGTPFGDLHVQPGF